MNAELSPIPAAHLSDFLAHITIGYYRLDYQDHVISANTAWLELHGYQSLNQVRGKHIRFAYVHPEEAEQLRERIKKQGVVKDAIYQLKRPDGEHFWASIYSKQITDENGQYYGREGIVHDVTEHVIHNRIMRQIPLGYYAVERKDGVDTITYCNQVFADMFGFSAPQEVVGIDISRLYCHPSDYEEFRNRLKFGKENSTRLQLEVQTIDGKRSFWMEANSNIERDAQGKPTGRVGVVRDLSQDAPLNKLRQDLGSVLHALTSGMITIKNDMDLALDALGSSLFPNAPQITTEQLLGEMRLPATNLKRSLTELLNTLAQRNAPGALRRQFQELHTSFDRAAHEREVFRAHALYDTAQRIAEFCQATLDRHEAPRQPLKEVRQHAFELMSVLARARLQERIGDVLQMEHDLRALRAYFTGASHQVYTPRSKFKLWLIVEQAMANLLDFAKSRGVSFQPAQRPSQAYVSADEQDILRVVMNLLHNAVKYSWSRESGTWIDISLAQSGSTLTLEIENFGVPIAADEIDSGLIYLFGYRGRLATDRGRVGTGIGLADATQTIRRYGGTVELRTRPASPGGQAEKRDPFLTKAIMNIPMAG